MDGFLQSSHSLHLCLHLVGFQQVTLLPVWSMHLHHLCLFVVLSWREDCEFRCWGCQLCVQFQGFTLMLYWLQCVVQGLFLFPPIMFFFQCFHLNYDSCSSCLCTYPCSCNRWGSRAGPTTGNLWCIVFRCNFSLLLFIGLGPEYPRQPLRH